MSNPLPFPFFDLPSCSKHSHLGPPMRKPGSRPEHVDLPAEPLLNEEQRAALDAALAKKRLEQGETKFNSFTVTALNSNSPVTTFQPILYQIASQIFNPYYYHILQVNPL